MPNTNSVRKEYVSTIDTRPSSSSPVLLKIGPSSNRENYKIVLNISKNRKSISAFHLHYTSQFFTCQEIFFIFIHFVKK